MSTLNIGGGKTNPADAVSAALAASATPAAPVEQLKVNRKAKPADKRGWWWGTGRRKSAVARVRLRPAKEGGSFAIKSNHKDDKPVDKYFADLRDQTDALSALKVTGMEGKFDVRVKAHGGGFMGQAQAIRLGVARALIAFDPAFYETLREHGFLTRDSREVERKKYGQAGARRRFQFSKR